MNVLAKTLLITVGTVSVVLGCLGLFLPVLPTTPFLLLAAFCYARSSQRFYDWLLNSPVFGGYIRNYREGGGMTRRHKITTIAMLWLTMGCTVLFLVPLLWVKILLLAVASCVTFYLLRIRTL